MLAPMIENRTTAIMWLDIPQMCMSVRTARQQRVKITSSRPCTGRRCDAGVGMNKIINSNERHDDHGAQEHDRVEIPFDPAVVLPHLGIPRTGFWSWLGFHFAIGPFVIQLDRSLPVSISFREELEKSALPAAQALDPEHAIILLVPQPLLECLDRVHRRRHAGQNELQTRLVLGVHKHQAARGRDPRLHCSAAFWTETFH